MDKKNEPEQAYVLYSRCINICHMLLESDDFETFKKSIDAMRFREIFERSMNEFERLENYLKNMYESIESAKFNVPQVEASVVKSDVHPVEREDFGNFIKPKELVNYVEKLHKIVLILDYRPNSFPSIQYKDPNLIRILPFSPESIQQR
jgi:tRNA splicing ligase